MEFGEEQWKSVCLGVESIHFLFALRVDIKGLFSCLCSEISYLIKNKDKLMRIKAVILFDIFYTSHTAGFTFVITFCLIGTKCSAREREANTSLGIDF